MSTLAYARRVDSRRRARAQKDRFDRVIGVRLQTRRIDLDWSYRQLAIASGLGYTTVYFALTQGRAGGLSLFVVLRLARAMQLDMNHLLRAYR